MHVRPVGPGSLSGRPHPIETAGSLPGRGPTRTVLSRPAVNSPGRRAWVFPMRLRRHASGVEPIRARTLGKRRRGPRQDPAASRVAPLPVGGLAWEAALSAASCCWSQHRNRHQHGGGDLGLPNTARKAPLASATARVETTPAMPACSLENHRAVRTESESSRDGTPASAPAEASKVAMPAAGTAWPRWARPARRRSLAWASRADIDP